MDTVVPCREGGLFTFLSSGQVELLRVPQLLRRPGCAVRIWFSPGSADNASSLLPDPAVLKMPVRK